MQKIKPVLLSTLDVANLFCDIEAIIKVNFEIDGTESFSTHKVFDAESYNLYNDYCNTVKSYSSYIKSTITNVNVHQNQAEWNKIFGIEVTFEEEMRGVFNGAYNTVNNVNVAAQFFIDNIALSCIMRFLDINDREAVEAIKYVEGAKGNNTPNASYRGDTLEIEVTHGVFSDI